MGEAAVPLARRRCEPCRGDTPPLRGEALRTLHDQLDPGWEIVDEHHLRRTVRTRDFRTALELANRIGELAEAEGHHPDLHLGWGRLGIELWTHKIDGLSEADFVLAAKIDEILREARELLRPDSR